jgi:hypothetical protein
MMQPGCSAMPALYLFLFNSPLNITFSCHHIYCHFELEFEVDSEVAVHYLSDLRPQESTLLCGVVEVRWLPTFGPGGWEDEALLLHTDPLGSHVQVLEWLRDTGKHGGVLFLSVQRRYMCKHICSLSVRYPETLVRCQY